MSLVKGEIGRPVGEGKGVAYPFIPVARLADEEVLDDLQRLCLEEEKTGSMLGAREVVLS